MKGKTSKTYAKKVMDQNEEKKYLRYTFLRIFWVKGKLKQGVQPPLCSWWLTNVDSRIRIHVLKKMRIRNTMPLTNVCSMAAVCRFCANGRPGWKLKSHGFVDTFINYRHEIRNPRQTCTAGPKLYIIIVTIHICELYTNKTMNYKDMMITYT